MAPPAKKAKTSNDGPKPVVFTTRGLTADVRLGVFNAEFHVHSVVLKMHSAFFFKFLDSPDKASPATVAPGVFKYEWVTKIDEDGSWSLVDARFIEKPDPDFDKFKGDKTKQSVAFEKLLKAIYAEEYWLLDFEELVLMTSFADYYRALPALSRSLYRVFVQQIFQVWECETEEISKVLKAAIKLRHPDLFRECVIIIAGQWDAEPDLHGYDRKIYKLINAARNRIGYNIAEAEKKILRLTARSDHPQTEINKVKFTKYLSFPEYYRNLKYGQGTYNTCNYGDQKDEVDDALDTVLENNLQFGGSKCLSGEEPFENHFLCAKIDYDDFPWDQTQTDW